MNASSWIAGSVLLPYELIATLRGRRRDGGARGGTGWTLVCGIDFGRRRDRTVCWTLEKVGDVLWTREVLVLEKMSTPEQVEILRTAIGGERNGFAWITRERELGWGLSGAANLACSIRRNIGLGK